MFILDNKENMYTFIGSSPQGINEKLESGVYNLIVQEQGTIIKFSKNEDYKKGIKLEQGIFKKVRNFFDNFFTDAKYEARQALGMKHKLGVIFTGDPGTGKTFLAGQIAQEICDKRNAIGILATKYGDYSPIIDAIRESDKDRLIVLIIDELEKTFRNYDTDALSFLSGAKERDNLVIIATVNDSTSLPSYIKDRPSRIEEEFNFTFKDPDVLSSVVNALIPKKYVEDIKIEELTTRLKKYKNTSIDRIKHIIKDIIAASIEMKETGIQREIIIKDDSISRTTVTGFGKQEEPENISDLIVESEANEILRKLVNSFEKMKSNNSIFDTPIPTEEIYSMCEN